VHSGGTPKNLSHLPLLFQSARERIDVVSCGKMGGIPQMTLKEWLKNT
ncbi:norphogenetic protein, partial [Escherichia coli]|nr:norphogenetic protein [Escherichia coli]